MKFFMDTAFVEEVKDVARTGLVDGITTNPSLVAKTGRKYPDVLREMCEIVDGPISAEVYSPETNEMVEEGKKLAKIHDNIVVKIPMTENGVYAAAKLVDLDIKVNMTLVFSAMQALICAKIGVDFVSPFVGRLDDISHSGMDLVGEILTIFDQYAFDTEVIVASVRHPLHVLTAAQMGAHIATLPTKTFKQLMKHPLTDVGMDKFIADSKKIPKD